MKKIMRLTDSIVGKIIIIIIPTVILYWGIFKDFNFNDIKIDNMEIGITIIFALIIFVSLQVRSAYFRLKTKQKYYDIMLTKYIDSNGGSPFLVHDDDLDLFTTQEKKYLGKYLREMNTLKIVMKGKNKVFGMFL